MSWIVLEKAQSLTFWKRQELRERDKLVKTTLGGWVAVRELASLGKREQRRRGRGAYLASRFLGSSFSSWTLTVPEQWATAGQCGVTCNK